jgi:predicted butyrate kinase (DUF1464 family)
MIIYKLKYNTKEEGLKDLSDKGILTEDGYGLNTLAVVHVGVIVDIMGTSEIIPGFDGIEEYDEEKDYVDTYVEITPTTYLDGYHIDVACKEDLYDFGLNESFPNNPKHTFA